MENIQKKNILKKKKRILSLLNLVSSLDETTIIFDGNQNHNFSKILKQSLNNALAMKTTIDQEVLKMKGLSGRKFRIMINSLVKLMVEPKYLEIGSWLGSTACSALYGNNIDMTCVDNFSQNFLPNLDPEKEFKKNINKYINEKSSFSLIKKDFRDIKYNKLVKHNIFFFDGPHHYKDHYDAISMVSPSMNDNFLMIIDDWNWKQVREATHEAINNCKLKIISSIEIKTTQDDSSSLFIGEHSDWHQGCIFLNVQK
ncbi:MAG: class I SAM-dependent methyltransferase [Alphaproteobacteria bacterium]